MDFIQKKILKIYALCLGIGIPYAAFVSLTGLGIPCMFKLWTGIPCPGCGTSHMFLAALGGDMAEAFMCNPAAFISVIAWMIISILAFAGRPAFVREGKFISACIYITLVLYIGVWLVRIIVNLI